MHFCIHKKVILIISFNTNCTIDGHIEIILYRVGLIYYLINSSEVEDGEGSLVRGL